MSRTTAGIMRINQELDKISGLGGIVSEKIEELENQIRTMVSDILENHSEASMFDYYGDGSNVLSSSVKYDASLRIMEIKKAIRNVQKDGLRVALNDGKLCVENTVRTMNTNDYTEPFGYAEIDCFGD
ncbi:hypothetical protein [Romboutsia ilealis]|jgi:hypothetical protein|uniref:hypothetical protein n=1 Tax=Romboutsia ilealis TaxID=1115758 RepID=UPI0026F383B5|nr:hypothetical protein [Romboutsia ilealis]